MEESPQQTPGISEADKKQSNRPQWVDDLPSKGALSNKEELTLKAELLEPQARDGALFVGSATSQATFDEIVSKVMENQQIRPPFHPIQQSLHDLQHPHLEATVHKLHLFQQM